MRSGFGLRGNLRLECVEVARNPSSEWVGKCLGGQICNDYELSHKDIIELQFESHAVWVRSYLYN